MIIKEIGLFAVVAKKETAEMVIMQLTKKYEPISKIVALLWGMKTSFIIRSLPIPNVCPTASKFSLIFPNESYIIKYGAEMKWMRFTMIKMAKVP